MVLGKNEVEVKEVWDKAWPNGAIKALIVAFTSDKDIAKGGIVGLKEFL